MRAFRIKSYAKLNLYLEVLRKRKDNYHQIVALFERIDLCDEISLSPRLDKRIQIISNHPGIPKGKANLAYQAASLLMKKSGIRQGLDIKINKRIPIAAGLGGGSSNAASVLLGLNRALGLNLARGRLISYAKMLGSDVPFFLSGAAFAVGRGRGENITAVTAVKRRFWHLLAVPKIKVSSKTVYARLDKMLSRQTVKQRSNSADFGDGLDRISAEVTGLTKAIRDVRILIQMLKGKEAPLIRKFFFNRLETASFDFCPKLKHWKNALLDLGVEGIYMTGSGPAMFSMVSSRKEAVLLRRKLSRFKDVDTFIVRTI